MKKYGCYSIVILMGCMSVAYGQTFKIEVGTSEIKGNLATTVTEGVGIRTSDPAANLIGTSFGSNGKPKGGTGSETTDDGDLNFRKGDVFSTPTKVFTRLNLTDGRYSVVVSTRAWVDATLETTSFSEGNTPGLNSYNKTLSDNRFRNLNKFANIAPWEAYGMAKWSLPNDALFSVNVGRQDLNWSTARFFLDSSHVNAVDAGVPGQPGALLDRELDIPLGLVSVGYKTASGLGFEGFYQLENRVINVPGCGTFFSEMNVGLDPGCSGMVANNFTGVNALYLPSSYAVWDNSAYSLAHNDVLPEGPVLYHATHNQGGLAIRYHVKSLNLDTTVYAMNLASRLPSVGAITSTNPNAGATPDAGLLQVGAPASYAAFVSVIRTIHYLWDYADNIHTFGANASTKLHGWNTAAEIEYVPNQAVGINAADTLMTTLGETTPLSHRDATLLQEPGSYLRGYDRYHNLRVDMNAMRVIPNVLKAKAFVVYVEAQDSAITNLPSLSQTRYGRGFQWGFSTQGYGGMAACGAAVEPLSGNITGCVNKGYVTANAFAYRTRLALAYVLKNGLALTPNVTWAHDVRGNSADAQMVEGRGVISPALEWQFKKKYFGGVSYTGEATSSTYNTQQDRDYAKVWVGYNF